MDDRTIRFYRENVYGNELLYPVDQAVAIEMLTGKKTLTKRTILALGLLGFSFVEVLKTDAKKGGANECFLGRG